jgi:hypothetical protein
LEKRTRILKQLSEIREKIINLRRRNLNINDNANGDADKKPAAVATPTTDYISALVNKLNATQ